MDVTKGDDVIKVGSINSLDASTRGSGKKNYSELLKNAQLNIAPIPEKEVQFKFRNTTCQWHEPLISALDVGYGFPEDNDNHTDTHTDTHIGKDKDVKIKNMLFDSVDLCVDEKSITCILGENQSGKTTLLKILSDQLQPIEGKVQLAHNATIAYFDQHKADNLIIDGMTKYGSTISSISLLVSIYPKKTEQEIRTQLICFGLSTQQSSTYIQFLSGGEHCRLCLAMLMINDPHVLILDEPGNHLDPESVNALAYGIKNWNGTVLLVSHDVHLIRQLEARCFILMKEGQLRYVQNGIHSYLQSLSTIESKKL
jgi:ATPase subunit of ABC transporter with duplicated ATPase domains